jgi:hypothetical protein
MAKFFQIHKALIYWIRAHHLPVDRCDDPKGMVFAAAPSAI